MEDETNKVCSPTADNRPIGSVSLRVQLYLYAQNQVERIAIAADRLAESGLEGLTVMLLIFGVVVVGIPIFLIYAPIHPIIKLVATLGLVVTWGALRMAKEDYEHG